MCAYLAIEDYKNFAGVLCLFEPRRFGVGARRHNGAGLKFIEEHQATILYEISQTPLRSVDFNLARHLSPVSIFLQDGGRIRLVQGRQVRASPKAY
jgi:hypothetical protein